MDKIRIYAPEKCIQHKGFPFFAERPDRLFAVAEAWKSLGLHVSPSSQASEHLLLLAHDISYVKHVKKVSIMPPPIATLANILEPYLQWYTRVSPHTFDAALYAVGAVRKAISDCIEKKTEKAFCAVRPPGHHAGRKHGEGFCIFNNVAIGALHASLVKIGRILVIDFDRHHGNGTEEILKGHKDIIFVSSFQEGCKYAKGKKGPPSNCMRIPIPEHATFDIVSKKYWDVTSLIRSYRPNMIFLSAGFDMHKDDPLTNIKMSSSDYYLLTKMIVEAAHSIGTRNIISVLEGGYELDALRDSVRAHLEGLMI